MERLHKLPSAFARYHKIGGVLDFAVFDDAGDSEEEAVAAIRTALGDPADFKADVLRSLGHRPIYRAEFLGDHYDLAHRKLVKRGSWITADGKRLVDPSLDTLDKSKIEAGGCGIPMPGEGGEFARAFIDPPYPLDAKPSEVQALFDQVHDFLMPKDEPYQILDWASPRLPEVSRYFLPGMEWWGVFLFTIYQPQGRRLIAIAGSTSD